MRKTSTRALRPSRSVPASFCAKPAHAASSPGAGSGEASTASAWLTPCALAERIEGVRTAGRHQRPDALAHGLAAHMSDPMLPGARRVALAHEGEVGRIGADGLGDRRLPCVAVPGLGGPRQGNASVPPLRSSRLQASQPFGLRKRTPGHFRRCCPSQSGTGELPGPPLPPAGSSSAHASQSLGSRGLLHQQLDVAGLAHLRSAHPPCRAGGREWRWRSGRGSWSTPGARYR